MCLLHLISEGNGYGYEMMKQLHGAFPDTKVSAVFALIRGLLKDGYIETAGKKTEGGPPRKYYSLTKSGAQKLTELLAAWRNLAVELENMGIYYRHD